MTEDQKREEARKRVFALKAFYINAISYALVMPVLIVWNVLDHRYWWFEWPLLGWGAGVIAQACSVYFPDWKPFGDQWQERKIQELMERR